MDQKITPRDRADKLIEGLEAQAPGMVLNGALKAAIIAKGNDMSEPLTFGDLKVGDRFITVPLKDDKSVRYILIKIRENTAIRLCDGLPSSIGDSVEVIQVE
jgi:hypothetical protein